MIDDMRFSKLIDEKRLAERIREMGQEITQTYKGQDLIAICVLKGSFMFYADLIRAIDLDVKCEFFGVSSYTGTSSSGEVRVTLDLNRPVEGQNLLLIEDIVDTGLTMDYMKKTFMARKPKSLTTVSLLLKPDSLRIPCEVDHVGFEIGNEFVVGYGLDYEGLYRNLPYIARVDNLN